jgi:hypothetical protein
MLFVHVDPQPQAVSVAVDMPRFLLPHAWQMARVQLTVVREVAKLELRIRGIKHRTAALRLGQKVAKEPETGFAFSDVEVGVFELFLPIFPRTSGALTIEVVSDRVTGSIDEVPFAVSDFLEVRLICRIKTKTAQLSALVKSPCAIGITEVRFFGQDHQAFEAMAIGLPLDVGVKRASALFVLTAIPESALIFVQEQGLQTFSLRLNVELLDDEAISGGAKEAATPATTFLPLTFSF